MKRLILRLSIMFVGCGMLYVIAAYFLAPPLVTTSLNNYATRSHGLQLQISSVTVNPFTLAVELQHVRLADHEQFALFYSPSVYANINMTDLLRRPLAINEISISRPQFNLAYSGQDDPGSVRALADIIQAIVPSAGSPPLPVDTINFLDGTIQFTDGSTANATPAINQINFQAEHLLWDQQDNAYSLTFTELNGGSFRFKGGFNLPGLSGSGEFIVDDLPPLTLSYWLDTIPDLEQATGRISVMGAYTISTGDAGSILALTDARLDISTFDLHTPAQSRLQVKDAAIDFTANLAIGNDPITVTISNISARLDEITFSDADAVDTVSRIQITGGSINPDDRNVDIATMSIAGGGVSVRHYLESRLVQPGPITSVLHNVTRSPLDWTDWQFTLNEFSTENIELTVIEIADDKLHEHHFSEIELFMQNISSAPGQHVDFEAGMVINRSGRFTANGQLDLHARSLQASATVDALDLVPFSTYIQQITPLTLVSALGSADMHLAVEQGAASIDARLDIDDLRLAREDGEPALTLTKLAALGVTLETSPLHASVKNLRLDELHVDVEQSFVGMLNVSEWINPGNSSPARDTRQIFASQRLPLTIDQVQFTESRIDFTDRSLTPALTLRANAISGDIIGLHLSADMSAFALRMPGYQPFEFVFMGQLNDSGDFSMSGKAWQTPTGSARQVSLQLNDLDSVLLSPYAGRHLDREIESGQFDIDLDYLVNGDVIRGHHRVHFDRLQLGQQTSASREDTPSLELALALLQDEQGQINLTSPIFAKNESTGLAIHSIAASAFTERLTAMLNNPFEILGEITGVTDTPLNMIPFEPGSAGVTPVAAQLLNGLYEALRQRPGLALRIAGGYDPGVDRDALARQQVRLHVTLAAAGGRPPGGTVTTLDMSDPRIQEVLDEFAGERLGKDHLLKLDHAEAGTPRFYQTIFDALVDEEEITASALESLAKYRLQSMMAELFKLGVTEDRLIIANPLGTEISEDGIVLIKLDLATL